MAILSARFLKFFAVKTLPATPPVVAPHPLPPVLKTPPGAEVGIHPLPPVELVGVTPPDIWYGPVHG